MRRSSGHNNVGNNDWTSMDGDAVGYPEERRQRLNPTQSLGISEEIRNGEDQRRNPSHPLYPFRHVCPPMIYLPKTSTTNESGRIVCRGCGCSGVGAGGGPNFAVTVKIWLVLGSSAMVRAPSWVGTFSATVNLPGESSRTT